MVTMMLLLQLTKDLELLDKDDLEALEVIFFRI